MASGTIKSHAPKVLYSGSATAASGSVPMTGSVANFKRIKVFCRNSDGYKHFEEVYNNGENFLIVVDFGTISSGARYNKSARFNFSGNQFTIDRPYEEVYRTAPSIAFSENNNVIVVERVEGYCE